MTHEGRQILYRIAIQVSREWGAALGRTSLMKDGYRVLDLTEPFGVYAWHDALEIVGDLRNGQAIKEQFRGKP